MVIDFNNIKAQDINSFNGGRGNTELKMYDDGTNKILYVTLHKNCTVGVHRHLNDCEIVYVISGNGKVLEEGELHPLKQGMCHYCKRGFAHSIMNDSDEDMVFFAVVPKSV